MNKTRSNREQAITHAMQNYIANDLVDDIEDDVAQLRSEYIANYVTDQLPDEMEDELGFLREQAINTERERLEAMTDEQLAAELDVEIEKQ